MEKGKMTKIALALIVVLMVGMLAGCGGGGGNKSSNVEDKDELIVATAYDAKSLDPHAVNDVASSNVMLQIYDTLVTIDGDGNINPSVAETFEQVDEVTY